MAMRLSGLMSGMDTEAVVAQLMKAHRLKTTKIQNKITTTEWKQEKWKDLNTKIYSFYTDKLSKMRMQSSFMVKKGISSNENKLGVIAGTNAPEGTHLIKVKKLASAQFVTGAKLDKDKFGNDVKMNTKLVDLGFDGSDGTTIHIKTADKEINLEVRGNTTLGDFVNALKSAGLNANYDTTHKRIFISSKASGVENAFSITTSSSELLKNKNAIRDFLDYDSLSSADKNKLDGYLTTYLNKNLTPEDKLVIRDNILEMKHRQERENFINNYMNDQDNISSAENKVREKLEEGENLEEDVFKAKVQDLLRQEAELAVFEEYEAWKDNKASDLNVFRLAEEKLDPLLTTYTEGGREIVENSGSLVNLKLGDIIKNDDGTVELIGSSDAKLIQASDAVIEYNNVELTGSSNNFTVNGLTLSLKEVTSENEVISVGVSGNTEAVYDMVKDFIKSYNELLQELNNAYYAESARGYDPLTDEERETMTEEQIKKWEDKIKDSLLRRDDILGSLISTLRNTLNEGVTVSGKTYSLTSFGISTQNYSEKGILHISGDADFSAVAASENKLMEALTNNPEEVMSVLNKLADNLYSSLMDRMKSTSLSSALTVYNDKEMAKTLTNYKSDLKRMEDRLAVIEERYYKQFAAMETAMARMNSQSASLMAMLGMNNQN